MAAKKEYPFKDFNDLKLWACNEILRTLLNGSLQTGVHYVLNVVLQNPKELFPPNDA